MREIITDLLDVLALLLIASGLGFQTAGWVSVGADAGPGMVLVATGGGLLVAGIVVLLGSYYAARRGEVPS